MIMVKDLKMRLPGWALNAIITAFIKGRWKEIIGLKKRVGSQGRLEESQEAAKECHSHQNVEEARNRFSPRASRASKALLTP